MGVHRSRIRGPAARVRRSRLPVVALDIDPHKTALLQAGRSYIRHLADARVRTVVERGQLTPSADFSALARCDAIVICVPTPLTETRDPDLSYVTGTTQKIRDTLRAGQLVVLESTTYPGTTDEVLKPMLEATGVCCAEDR